MNVLLQQCGMDHYVWVHRARRVVMRENTACWSHGFPSSPTVSDQCKLTKAISNLLLDHYDYDCPSDMEDFDDDDECSMEGTTSCSSDESHSHGHRVSFGAPLVTATYERPTTTPQEKLELYYTEMDYRAFRRDYLVWHRMPAARRRLEPRRSVVVQIHPQVVTATHTIPTPDDPAELYYTQSDLQGFLDEFVRSLVKG